MGKRREDEERRRHATPEITRGELVTAAEAIAAAYPYVEAVYLFGSRARGDARPTSDVDLAVLLDRTGPSMERVLIQEELARFVEERLGVPTDVLVVDRRLSPALLFDIFAVETILCARDDERAHRVACQARAEYRDLLPRLERIFARVRRRIEERADALNRP